MEAVKEMPSCRSRAQGHLGAGHNNSQADGLVRDEFINWLYKSSKDKRKHLQPLSEMVQYCRDHYWRSETSGNKTMSTLRRTLSPRVDYELVFASTAANDFFTENCKRRKENMSRGYFGPIGKKYRELGHNIGRVPLAEPDTRDVFIEHMANGLTSEEFQELVDLKKKKPAVRILEMEGTDIYQLLRKVKAEAKKIGKEVHPKESLRQTNTMLQQGTRQMYDLLHETEHRLLAVQSGSTYMQHVEACKKRRSTEHKLLKVTREAKSKMEALPVTDLHSSDMQIDGAKVPSSPEVTGKCEERVAAASAGHPLSSNGSEQQTTVRRTQLCYDKLLCIYTVLSIMRSMKKSQVGQGALPWDVLKKLRVDPFLEYRPQSGRLRTSNKDPLSRQSGQPSVSFSTQPPFASLATRPWQQTLVLPQIREPTPLIEKKSIRQTLATDQNKYQLTNQCKVNGEPLSSIHRLPSMERSMGKTGCAVQAQPSQTDRGRNLGLSTPNGQRSRKAVGSPSASGLCEDIPVLTWEEFLKIGLKPEEKTKRTKLAYPKGTPSDQKAVEGPTMNDYSRRSLTFTPSSPQLSKSVSLMWRMMRKSFYNTSQASQKHSINSLQLLKEFGLDKNNPISHLQMNWLKIKLQANKSLMREVSQMQQETEARYRKVKKNKDLQRTNHWRHKWVEAFNQSQRDKEYQVSEMLVDCIEKLRDEARQNNLLQIPLVVNLFQKLTRIYSEDAIKYGTIYTGQAKIQTIILSLPAFELCTLPMQSALQFVLVDVLHGSRELLIPMMKQRGLPIHPGVLGQSEESPIELFKESAQKVKVVNFVKNNMILSAVPPTKPGSSRNIISRLEKNVVFSNVL